MANQVQTLELYEKRNATHIKEIGHYANRTKKLVWYEQYGKKCCLASVLPTVSKYKMKVSISFDEMVLIRECLLKAKKGGSHNFFISEREDWKKDLIQLVLKDSDYGGLLLQHLTADKPLDVLEGDVPDGSEDVELATTNQELSSSSVEPVEVEWVESWNKFYISKNEDWAHVANVLKEFFQALDHTMNVDEESTIPPTPPATPSTFSSPFSVIEVQKLVGGNPSLSGKTKGKTGEKEPKKKRKRVLDSDGEVGEQHKFVTRCVTMLLNYMIEHKISSFDEVISKYGQELKQKIDLDFHYEKLREFSDKIEDTCQKLLHMCELSDVSPRVICETVLFF
jgi:hypothetical protein